MYDIQSALRRRAMAERLEALSRADEATDHAANAPEGTDVPSRPRHLAEPSPEVAPLEVAQLEVAQLEVAPLDVAQLEVAQLEVAPVDAPSVDGPPAGGTSYGPASPDPHDDMPVGATALEITSVDAVPPRGVVEYDDDRPARRPISSPLPPPQPGAPVTPATGTVAPASGPLAMPAPDTLSASGETRLAVRAPDQTARLEVAAARLDPSAPPPVRGGDLAVPPGVTLLRDSLRLPDSEPLDVRTDDVIDLTVVESQTTVADPVDADPVDAGPAEVEFDVEHDDGLDDDPPRGGSSASTIADLLRHGSSGLFFKKR